MSGVTIRRIVVRGRVQGVGYRAWTEDTAILNGLDGWVRNRRDGAVEAVFAGSAEAVDAMIDACRRGPESARVEAVDAARCRTGRSLPCAAAATGSRCCRRCDRQSGRQTHSSS